MNNVESQVLECIVRVLELLILDMDIIEGRLSRAKYPSEKRLL